MVRNSYRTAQRLRNSRQRYQLNVTPRRQRFSAPAKIRGDVAPLMVHLSGEEEGMPSQGNYGTVNID